MKQHIGQQLHRPGKILTQESGINNKVNVEILEGLNEGDTLILGMPNTLSDNTSRRMGPPGMRF